MGAWPMLGLALLLTLIVASGLVAWIRGFSLARIVFYVLGTLVGGALGATPGAVCSLLLLAATASGTSPFPAWPVSLFLAGGAAGALLALLIMNWIRRRPAALMTWVFAFAGYVAGIGISYLALLLIQDVHDTRVESAYLALSPVTIAAATVAGYACGPAKKQNASGQFEPPASGD